MFKTMVKLASCGALGVLAGCQSLSSAPPKTSLSAETQPQSNDYQAPRATTEVQIDGLIDPVWDAAPWQAMDVLWLGAQAEYPTPEDYSGRFKILWDERQLYLLFEITDDVIYDHARDPFDAFWIDDTVELFIDEDRSGGPHHTENDANAWAYHLSTYKDNVDNVGGKPILLNDHVTLEIKSEGNLHIWEMSVRVYADDYDFTPGATNQPVELYEGKVLGFSAAYIDNDNSIPESAFERESMMGSVDTQGHKDNQGYLNADVFGTLTLIE